MQHFTAHLKYTGCCFSHMLHLSKVLFYWFNPSFHGFLEKQLAKIFYIVLHSDSWSTALKCTPKHEVVKMFTQNTKIQQFKSLSNNKGTHTTRLSWQCPFNVVGCKDRLLNAAAFHQIIGKHSWTQAVLGATVHKHQLRQWMREKRTQLQQKHTATFSHMTMKAITCRYPVWCKVNSAFLGPF